MVVTVLVARSGAGQECLGSGEAWLVLQRIDLLNYCMRVSQAHLFILYLFLVFPPTTEGGGEVGCFRVRKVVVFEACIVSRSVGNNAHGGESCKVLIIS